ncbi:MAG: DUF362 domain-containing protein [Bacteroidales bacterium]|nr:DUF362 domain-containing protein [Bacteroidales bacterium]
MKKTFLFIAAAFMFMVGCKQNNQTVEAQEPAEEGAAVYMTSDISPEALIKLYEALGVKAEGRVAVKISTGEAGGHNYLKPELIGDFVKHVGGKLVECNTTYAGQRRTTEQHLRVIEDHGFNTIGGVDIMDAEGEMQIPVRDTTYMKYDLVGSHLQNYDFLVNLAHFKGHQMGGFGGVLKNQSIGVASANGKAYIHSNGRNLVPEEWFNYAEPENQDKFLECMATAATAVHDYFKGKVIYINVMNNMSIDCDCNGNPAAPELKDMGILASTDPVALDQACLDLVYQHQNAEGDDATSLKARIEKQHGIHTVEHAEKIGLGSRKYHIIKID